MRKLCRMMGFLLVLGLFFGVRTLAAALPDDIERISIATDGTTQGNNNSDWPSASFDGRYIVFTSMATSFASGDDNFSADIFLHDTQMGETWRISENASGEVGNGPSSLPIISSDGRYVAFRSIANNLVSGVTNSADDIYRYDRVGDSLLRVSVATGGGQSDGGSHNPAISADGRYVVFESEATNLVAGDDNEVVDIFMHDVQTTTTTRISVDSAGLAGNGDSTYPAISSDGRYVAFRSDASNLVTGDSNHRADIFLHDTVTGTTTRISCDQNDTEGDGASYLPSISADGRYVAFYSYASNLVPGDTNGVYDVFVKDVQTGSLSLVSVSSTGAYGNQMSRNPSISDDGRYVAFQSQANNLVSGDTNNKDDIFVHDRVTGQTIRVSVDASGEEADNTSTRVDIVGNGPFILFDSFATNLVAGDTNGYNDVFLTQMAFVFKLFLPMLQKSLP